MKNEQKLKKVIKVNHLEIRLFEVNDADLSKYESASNIEAVDDSNRLVWAAEPPVSHYEHYHTMELDSAGAVLIAVTGSGYKHFINLSDGKIIDYYLIK